MWKKNDGFLLFESLLAMLVLTIGVIGAFETLVYLHQKETTYQNDLELAIFAKEWQQMRDSKDKIALLEKAKNNQIKIKESGETHFIIEKNGSVLDISKKE